MQGYLDRCDSTVAGWAFDDSNPLVIPLISININGIEVKNIPADLVRNDLRSAIGITNRGFSFDIESSYHNGAEICISVFAHGTSILHLGERHVLIKSKVIKEESGWLFLTNDSNRVDQRLAGESGCDTQEINRFAILMLSREAIMEKLGISYYVVVMPEKNVVCNIYRKKPYVISENRPIKLIEKVLSKFGGNKFLYPLNSFEQFPDRFFNKTDTHSSAEGYLEIQKELAFVLPQYYINGFVPKLINNTNFVGDLAGHISPTPSESILEFEPFPLGCIELISDPIPGILAAGGKLRGSITRIKNKLGKKDRLLIVGTSSAYYGLSAFIGAFRDVLFVWGNALDYLFINSFNPSCILWIATERFLPTHLDDIMGLPDLEMQYPMK
jgi:hypothetical protein